MHLLPTSLVRQLRLPSLLLGAFAFAAIALVGSAHLSAQDGVHKLDLPDYRIVARDELKFQITGEPDDPLIERVSTAGEISIPFLGAFRAAGLTLREAESQIERRYRDGGFFVNPQVILSFNSYAPRSVSVLGQVNNPSSVDFSIEREDMGLVSAITKAGGFTRVARPDAVKVMRNIDGKDTAFIINVTGYLNETSKEPQFKLMPDDIVFVPERVF
ncbi:MAG TPA: polysaccharide biosynthesis/export family protein [Isosphaeraceae bacterium]|nr:polysaccharide biosynthesis/export family protein [Isosphaeraceae bacterium]